MLALCIAVTLQSFSPASASPTQTFACAVPGSTFVDSWHAPRVGHLHIGVDMMAPDGTPILAPEGGTYRPYSSESFYLDGDSGTEWFGTHLQGHIAGAGRVEQGQPIALVGHSGNASASGPHLHLEQRPAGEPINPFPAMDAACSGPSPEVVTALKVVAEVGAPPAWPYTRIEVQRWWNQLHNPNIDRPTATRLTAYLNAVVELRLQQYLLAVYLNSVQTSSCSGPATCGPMISSIFSSLGLDPNAGVRVATCESGLNPGASNGGRFLGLFQQAAQYWAGRAAQYGMAGRSAFDGYANAYVSARMVRDGGWGPWECRP